MQVLNQSQLFLIFVVTGIIIGTLFDFFRILRKAFITPDFITYIEDIIFWILTGILILYTIFIFNNGELRFYIILGIILGISFYILLLSKYIIKIAVPILTTIKNIIYLPIKLIFKPISFICINIRKIMTNIFSKISKTIKKITNFKKNQKNQENKKEYI